MPYTLAEIVFFIFLLVGLWFVLFKLAEAWLRRREANRPPKPTDTIDGEIVRVKRNEE